MKKRRPMLMIIIFVSITALFLADAIFGLGIYSRLFTLGDNEAPVINTSELPSQYLLNSDSTIDATCTDNMDETCSVGIIGTFDTSVLGEQTVTLVAADIAGNVTTYEYTFEIVEDLGE